MESSEDDAGAATNASRRVSAREKDVGRIEDGNATSSLQRDPSEARTCQTPAMSEDNFDGDSVLSPSTHDVNTSTEAILDMIDEIVDGPGAPKRLPQLENDSDSRFAGGGDCYIRTSGIKHDDSAVSPSGLASVTSAKSEENQCVKTSSPSEQSSQSDVVHLATPESVILTESKTSHNSVSSKLSVTQGDVLVDSRMPHSDTVKSESDMCTTEQLQSDLCPQAESEVCATRQTFQSEILVAEQTFQSEVCKARQISQSEVCAAKETSQSEVCVADQTFSEICAPEQPFLSESGQTILCEMSTPEVQTIKSEASIEVQTLHSDKRSEGDRTELTSQSDVCAASQKLYSAENEVQMSNSVITPLQSTQSEDGDKRQTLNSPTLSTKTSHTVIIEEKDEPKSQNEECAAVHTSESEVCATEQKSRSEEILEGPISNTEDVQTSQSEAREDEMQISHTEMNYELDTSHSEASEEVQTSESAARKDAQILHSEPKEEGQTLHSEGIEEVQTSHSEAKTLNSEVRNEAKAAHSEASNEVQISQSKPKEDMQTSHIKKSEEKQISDSEVSNVLQTSHRETSNDVQTSHSETKEKVQTQHSEIVVEVNTSKPEVCEEILSSHSETVQVQISQCDGSEKVQTGCNEPYDKMQSSNRVLHEEKQNSYCEEVQALNIDVCAVDQRSDKGLCTPTSNSEGVQPSRSEAARQVELTSETVACEEVQGPKTDPLPEVQSSQSEAAAEVKSDSIVLPQQSISVLESSNSSVSVDTEKSMVSCSEDPSDSLLANIPSSSVVPDESVSQTQSANERTLKCVTSSDNQDSVIVESAESTSSDISISDSSRAPVAENVTRSPLRRKLVRPAPNRPDSTVSSTVDSSINVCKSEQANESLVKDVSSSSDAVPSVHHNTKPEEIRNISEVSICKAETSSSSSKRIKLIRQKTVPQKSHAQPALRVDAQPKAIEREQCQSTSSEMQTPTESRMQVKETMIGTVSNVSQSDIIAHVENIPSIIQSNSKLPVQSDSITERLSNNLPISETVTIAETVQETSNDKPIAMEVCVDPPKIYSSEKEDADAQKKLPPFKINISTTNKVETVDTKITTEKENTDSSCSNVITEESDSMKQVPKLTIKLSGKHTEEMKSPIPKVTIKPIKPPAENELQAEESIKEQIPHVTKLNIKPVIKQPEKINEIHRKSSSSEISESEYSENDESTSTSDQASASDQGSKDVVPKVTIKLGKPGTESEGQFYTEKNIPKLTIKAIQNSEHEEQLSPSKLKVFISQSADIQTDKIPKLTIKTVTKCESQPLSPKLTIKPIKPPDPINDESGEHGHSQEVLKLKISTEAMSSNTTIRNLVHTAPKLDTVSSKSPKMANKSDPETTSKNKKTAPYENFENIPVVTKLNIKPLTKPSDSTDLPEGADDKVPVVSKLIIKPIVKSNDSEVDYSKDDVPKITKLNIKPLKSPETNSFEEKDCDDVKADIDGNSIPIITKLNIKPIVKPHDENISKGNENQSSETGNSSDDNTDIPFVTKINIKPICKPNDLEESGPSIKKEENIPVITKLNIKPLVKPEESASPISPKKELLKHSAMSIPTVTKLNIKPVMKPEELKSDDVEETSTKNPPLVMKINRKTVESYVNENQYIIDKKSEHEHCNNVSVESIPVVSKINIKPIIKPTNTEASDKKTSSTADVNCKSSGKINQKEQFQITAEKKEQLEVKQNCVTQLKPNDDKLPVSNDDKKQEEITSVPINAEEISYESKSTMTDFPIKSHKLSRKAPQNEEIRKDVCNAISNSKADTVLKDTLKITERSTRSKNLPTRQNCMLLKKLLETRKEKVQEEDLSNEPKFYKSPSLHTTETPKSPKNVNVKNDLLKEKSKFEAKHDMAGSSQTNDIISNTGTLKVRSMQELCKEANENVTKPLEINVSDKVSQHSSDQDSPRIILKINKTEQGASSKIITEEPKKPEQPSENIHKLDNDVQQKKTILNSRKKTHVDTPMPVGKRLRSSRILPSEKTPLLRRTIVNKRPSDTESSPPKMKQEPELSVLETKRLKLGQLLSNKALTITPIVAKTSPVSPPAKPSENKQGVKHHSILNNENCAKNGSSKLHNILSNLQAKQLQNMPLNDLNHTENSQSSNPDLRSSASTGSPEIITEIVIEKSTPEEVQMIFNDNSESHDFSTASEEMAQDPLQVDNLKPSEVVVQVDIPKMVELTPQPKKRGRPRKIPLSEGAKPVVTLPTPALEERPQRSLRLSRDRPAIIAKPRGRGRGRGRRIVTEPAPSAPPEPVEETANKFFVEQKPAEEIDPTSSRIKLPRMTEALDKMPSVCSTPLTSRRRSSSPELRIFAAQDLKVMVEQTPLPKMEDPFLKSPVIVSELRGRGSRGGRWSRGRGRGRSPRGRGRGRGGGRGAMYMKETMGIYGRVCGPATTTVQLFEEETCMMDDNATPAKPSHLLDEDSQSSLKSSTNDSSKMRKSKFADLFDSNKVWTAADVKEYTWPPPEQGEGEKQVMMIQEQVAMFLGVKSFKRRYPELKRRTISADERAYVLSKGLVTEALCDLGITAVDASEVLDIMLSDYPHKYEEYRSHQRERQRAEPEEVVEEVKPEVKVEKVDGKEQKPEQKPELPKVDPEKLRQEMAAAAVASASEWNARLNAMRRPACADLQTLTVQRRRPPPAAPPRVRVQPPAGFYPHALLPGQYQHSYRVYTPEELRYFPLNTALAAPPAPPSPAESSSESEPEWGSRCSSTDDSDTETHRNAKRKKITKTKRSSHTEASNSSVKEEEAVDTCRVCKLRLEANRKYTHERFLVCANCNAKLHPSCVELSPDTIRKCREYAWQCAECKTCCGCSRPADDDKMLFCDLCDRGFHIYCVGLDAVPNGRWHCAECAICKSCGARDPSGAGGNAAGPSGLPGAASSSGVAGTPGGSGTPGLSGTPGAMGSVSSEGAEWHHQTRRGPGGHKVYSHSLCTPCARAYRIGRYCPLCERSFIGPKGTMQLVICKLCDRQLHQECVKATVSSLNVLDYTCGECRRGGITSRAAAVRLAPRTIATLFMAKRRFNKYAHRQYLQSRARELADADCELADDAPDAADPLDVGHAPDT